MFEDCDILNHFVLLTPLTVAMPRYIRVNRLKITPQEVEDAFKADGYECVLSREEADEQMRTTDPAINR